MGWLTRSEFDRLREEVLALTPEQQKALTWEEVAAKFVAVDTVDMASFAGWQKSKLSPWQALIRLLGIVKNSERKLLVSLREEVDGWEYDPLHIAAAQRIEDLLVQLAKYQDAIQHHCQCRFRDGKRLEECHYHQCERSIRLPNGDPSDVTKSQRIRELEDALRPFADFDKHSLESVHFSNLREETMTRFFCDRCGREADDSRVISFPQHFESPFAGLVLDGGGEPFRYSASDNKKEVCLRCYSAVMQAAWTMFNLPEALAKERTCATEKPAK